MNTNTINNFIERDVCIFANNDIPFIADYAITLSPATLPKYGDVEHVYIINLYTTVDRIMELGRWPIQPLATVVAGSFVYDNLYGGKRIIGMCVKNSNEPLHETEELIYSLEKEDSIFFNEYNKFSARLKGMMACAMTFEGPQKGAILQSMEERLESALWMSDIRVTDSFLSDNLMPNLYDFVDGKAARIRTHKEWREKLENDVNVILYSNGSITYMVCGAWGRYSRSECSRRKIKTCAVDVRFGV